MIYLPTSARYTSYLEIDGTSPGVWIKNVDILKKRPKQELLFEANRVFGLVLAGLTSDRKEREEPTQGS